MNKKIGIICINLGSPESYDPGDIKKFLKKFLSDDKLIRIPKFLWWPILNGIILKIRPKKLSPLYKKIWAPQGSPLIVFGNNQARLLQIKLNEKYKNNIIQYETELSKFNCKSVNIEEFKNYIVEKNKLNTKTSDFYNQILFRKLKWRNLVYGRKSEDRFLNRINEVFNPEGKNGNKNNLLLSYGNWSNNKQMKYIVPTKGIGLRKSIQKKYNGLT